ncbi:hypothetical protein LR48_Vigan08g110800 [Vigna angularis]|uniref:Uncharacterized protein n=1 Tax=Phaseolus angularis TaxID=3914 RepID=A0A0L9V5G9_PHAAN|nr:hypothetical protein LR48_Vigan08g110800 [Vigna angularis]
MASSSHPSRDRGKAIVAARNVDLSGWISDEETHLEFMRPQRDGASRMKRIWFKDLEAHLH